MRQAASLQEDKQRVRAAEVYASLPTAISAIEVSGSAAQLAAGKCLYLAGKMGRRPSAALEQGHCRRRARCGSARRRIWLAASAAEAEKRPDGGSQRCSTRRWPNSATAPQTVQLQLDRADARMFDQPGKSARRHRPEPTPPLPAAIPTHMNWRRQAEYLVALAALEAGDYPQASCPKRTNFSRSTPHAPAPPRPQYIAAESRLLAGQPTRRRSPNATKSCLKSIPGRDEATTWRRAAGFARPATESPGRTTRWSRTQVGDQVRGRRRPRPAGRSLLLCKVRLVQSELESSSTVRCRSRWKSRLRHLAPLAARPDETLLASWLRPNNNWGTTCQRGSSSSGCCATFLTAAFAVGPNFAWPNMATAAGDDRRAATEYRRVLAADASSKGSLHKPGLRTGLV